jgi:hypothetical protein
MNPFEMVVGIVIVVTIGSLIRSLFGGRRDRKGRDYHGRDQAGDDRLIEEIKALREEIKSLKKRQAVIERITVEKESSLEREIERLRDQ